MIFRPPRTFDIIEAAAAAGVHSGTIKAWIGYGLGSLISIDINGEPRFTADHVVLIAVGAALAACGYRELTALAAAYELGEQVKDDTILLARPDGVSTRAVRVATANDLAALAAPIESVLVIPIGRIAARVREALA